MAQIIPEPVKRSISRLREDIHSMLDRWRRRRNDGATDGQQLSNMAFGPPVDFEDKDDEVVVVAEIPGFDENDVQIEVMDNRLILRGQKNLENEERGSNYYRLERGVTEFTRVIPLPPGIDADNARAKFKNGLLRVVLPKAEDAKAKRIEVRAT
ncbi:Hsp20/alpha crystallin family protein [Candidatus Binatus sp.]|uniref:Hsp20/alpha crystallin family protein n=2 Tax=Candidatus Binatus sp. TaxID=2811406 RepID=UPI003CC5D6AC